MTIPLIILAIGALSVGYLFKELLIGNQSDYWRDSILFLNYLKLENIPLWIILITPILVISAIPISYLIFIKDKTILEGMKKSNKPLYDFLLNKWYIDEIYNFLFIEPTKELATFFGKKEMKTR